MNKLLASLLISTMLILAACGSVQPQPGDYDFIGPLEEGVE